MEHKAPERAINGLVMFQQGMPDIEVSFRVWSFEPSRKDRGTF
jgi:hypothetical protein